MNAIASPVPLHLLQELTMHLIKSGSPLTVAEAASAAIRAWIARHAQAEVAVPPSLQGTEPAPTAEPSPSRGYQWKDLFLPEGTELRMCTAGHTYHARVTGDDIIYKGRRVSPRGLTLVVAGDGRNAWRDVWIRFAGQRHFLPASAAGANSAHRSINRQRQCRPMRRRRRLPPAPTASTPPCRPWPRYSRQPWR